MSQDLCDVDELLLSSEDDDSHDDGLELESILEDDDEYETDEENSESTDIIE